MKKTQEFARDFEYTVSKKEIRKYQTLHILLYVVLIIFILISLYISLSAREMEDFLLFILLIPTLLIVIKNEIFQIILQKGIEKKTDTKKSEKLEKKEKEYFFKLKMKKYKHHLRFRRVKKEKFYNEDTNIYKVKNFINTNQGKYSSNILNTRGYLIKFNKKSSQLTDEDFIVFIGENYIKFKRDALQYKGTIKEYNNIVVVGSNEKVILDNEKLLNEVSLLVDNNEYIVISSNNLYIYNIGISKVKTSTIFMFSAKRISQKLAFYKFLQIKEDQIKEDIKTKYNQIKNLY